MKKGDSVVSFTNWDRKGTFAYRAMRVESWGAKRASLRDEITGEMMKYSLGANRRDHVYLASEFPNEESRITKAIALAEQFLIEERARYELCIARDDGQSPGYRKAIDLEAALIHEPRATEWNTAAEAFRLKHTA